MKSLKNRKNRKNTPNKSDSFPLHNWQKCWLHRTQYMCSMTYGPRASYISYGIHIPRTSHLLRNKNRSKQYAERNHIRVLVNFFSYQSIGCACIVSVFGLHSSLVRIILGMKFVFGCNNAYIFTTWWQFVGHRLCSANGCMHQSTGTIGP